MLDPTRPTDHPGASALADLLLTMARAMVDDTAAVCVESTCGERTVILTLIPGPDDFGKVIGKGGNNANAMRTILGAAAGALGLRVNLEIPTPERVRRPAVGLV